MSLSLYALVRRMPTAVLALFICFAPAFAVTAQEAPSTETRNSAVDDRFLAGYATAVVRREFGLSHARVEVRNGTITIRNIKDLSHEARRRLAAALSQLDGVREVRLDDYRLPESEKPRPKEEVTAREVPGEGVIVEPRSSEAKWTFLPKTDLFEPLIADPRWPHFSVTYQRYIGDSQLKDIFAPSFGETLPLFRGSLTSTTQWELGAQAAVYPILDLDAESFDLVNADYWVGGTFSLRRGEDSLIFRLFHQSSHLGDEFLLRNRVERVNLSYEAVDLIYSREIGDRLRLYAGAQYIFHKEPSNLEPWIIQYGVEFQSPLLGHWQTFGVRAVAGADFKNVQEADWDANVSLRAGFQFENPSFPGTRLQLMLEYFTGRSPNGQFYERTIEYIGTGLHVYF